MFSTEKKKSNHLSKRKGQYKSSPNVKIYDSKVISIAISTRTVASKIGHQLGMIEFCFPLSRDPKPTSGAGLNR
jgi:hypothetical protein